MTTPGQTPRHRLVHPMQSAKRRVMLVGSKHLFSEGLEDILRKVSNVELFGPTELSQDTMSTRLQQLRPDAVIVIESDDMQTNVAALATAILQQFPNLLVIIAGMEQNIFRIISTHTIPARSSDLVEAILNLPAQDPWDATQLYSHPRSRRG